MLSVCIGKLSLNIWNWVWPVRVRNWDCHSWDLEYTREKTQPRDGWYHGTPQGQELCPVYSVPSIYVTHWTEKRGKDDNEEIWTQGNFSELYVAS